MTNSTLPHASKDDVIIHGMPIQERIDWLIHHADRHSQEFKSPESWLARSRYHAKHPTDIVAFKCMDGRINIPVATNTPYGIMLPFRNLGGRFHPGWPHLGEVSSEHVQSAAAQGRRTLALVIGPYSPDLADPIRKAAGLIEANMRAGRIPDDSFLLLAETPYREIGVDHACTELKSRFLSGIAADVIRTEFPILAEKMHVLTAVLAWQSRAMEIIDGRAA